MFKVHLGIYRNDKASPFTLLVEGCPRSGVEAIDFRRAAGLPDGPTNEITLPGYSFEDEAFVRSHPDRASKGADIETEYDGGLVAIWACNAVGNVYQGHARSLPGGGPGYGGLLFAEPATIAAYLREQTPDTARALLLSLWGYTERSRIAAEAEAARIAAEKAAKEQALAAARELLAPELEGLRSEIKSLTAKVRYLEVELADARSEDEEALADE